MTCAVQHHYRPPFLIAFCHCMLVLHNLYICTPEARYVKVGLHARVLLQVAVKPAQWCMDCLQEGLLCSHADRTPALQIVNFSTEQTKVTA